MLTNVLVTGAGGFVGGHLTAALVAGGYRVRVALRTAAVAAAAPSLEVVSVGDLAAKVDWRPALEGIDGVVHLAGVAHATGLAPELYDAVNHRATAALGRAAVEAGVRRLVFLSSVLAQAGPAAAGTLTEDDPPLPAGPYGASKLRAEQALAALPLDTAVLRPVLVYGRGVKGNMAQLLKLARRRLPLPFGAVRNRRSLVAAEDLVGAIRFSLEAPQAVNGTFLVAGDEPLSLPEMIAAMRAGWGRKPGLLAVPPALLRGAAALWGKGDAWERAGGSLVASNRRLRALGWAPEVDTRDGLARLARSLADR